MENVSLRFMAVVEEMETGFYIFLQIYYIMLKYKTYLLKPYDNYNYQILEYI